jgi:hypothetical protein
MVHLVSNQDRLNVQGRFQKSLLWHQFIWVRLLAGSESNGTSGSTRAAVMALRRSRDSPASRGRYHSWMVFQPAVYFFDRTEAVNDPAASVH